MRFLRVGAEVSAVSVLRIGASWKERLTWWWIYDPCSLSVGLRLCTLLDNLGFRSLLDDPGLYCRSNLLRLRSGWDQLRLRSGLADLSPRPLSRCESCPRWWAPRSITGVENGTEDGIRITRVICTHLLTPLLSPLFSTNFSHLLTTSSIVGRFLGFCCQQLSRRFHISAVSPTA